VGREQKSYFFTGKWYCNISAPVLISILITSIEKGPLENFFFFRERFVWRKKQEKNLGNKKPERELATHEKKEE